MTDQPTDPYADEIDSWIAVWATAIHGPHPEGSPIAQPDLAPVIPSPEHGLVDQAIRMAVRPTQWGEFARVRLTNRFGDRPLTLSGVYLGLQASGAQLVAGTNCPVQFSSCADVTISPGGSVLSDPVRLGWFSAVERRMLEGRRLAVSMHVVGKSGPISWHSKALTSNYISRPGQEAAASEDEGGYPYSISSWLFVSQIDMQVPGARTIVAFGDSLTDGTGSTINGDDRWADVLSRRLERAWPGRFSIVNAGIGGNMIVGDGDSSIWQARGEPAVRRVDSDVLAMPNLGAVFWLEGLNDINADVSAAAIEEGIRSVVARLRERRPGVRIVMGTLTPSKGSVADNNPARSAERIRIRSAVNAFIRTCGLFDGVVDFATLTEDPATGELRAEFQPDSSIGGAGDKIHLGRTGYSAMGHAIDLAQLTGLPETARSR